MLATFTPPNTTLNLLRTLAGGVTVSAAAHAVLGCLAAFDHSGPHRAPPLRRLTHLSEDAYRCALRELAELGLVRLEQDDLWVTTLGGHVAGAAFA